MTTYTPPLGISRKQMTLLRTIRRLSLLGRCPSYGELARSLRTSRSSAYERVRCLRRMGLVEADSSSHSIRLTTPAIEALRDD